MLKYMETNWRAEKGLEINNYQITFSRIDSKTTTEEQGRRAERLSLVKILDNKTSDYFLNICDEFHKNNQDFYYNKHKKLHTTLLGFPVVDPVYYGVIKSKIEHYAEQKKLEDMNVKFDNIRLGTKYQNSSTLDKVNGTSNGTIIAFGSTKHNAVFTNFGNGLARFLLDDRELMPVIGKKFRRRFPTVWCTMGYYTTDFEIPKDLETLFNKYKKLNNAFFQNPRCELELGTSNYKDLRDWKSIQNFTLPKVMD